MLQKESFFRRPEPLQARPPQPPPPPAPAPQPAAHPVIEMPRGADKSEERKEAKLIVGPDIKMKGVEVTDCDTLVVHATGRLSGKIRYARIKVEEGAELSGEISVLDKSPASALPRRANQL